MMRRWWSTLACSGRVPYVSRLVAHSIGLLAPGEVGRGGNRGYNVTSKDRGNQADYLARRIARDRPDILEGMKRGEYRSVRAAAKEAGIVKEPTPLQRLHTAWRQASQTEREAFLRWIDSQAELS